jgi:hypothetical protein
MKRAWFSLLLVTWAVDARAQTADRNADGDAARVAPASAAPSGAVTQRWQASLNLDALIRRDSSFDLLGDEDVEGGWGLSVSRAWWLTRALAVAPELGYAGSRAEGGELLGGAVQRVELASSAAYAGVSARYEIWDYLAPHARLAAGMARTELTLDTQLDGTFEAAEWLPFATLGAGATLTTPDRFFQSRSGALASFSVGLSLEGGYWLSAPLETTLDTGSEGRLPVAPANLGDLSRSGPYVRLAFVARL